MRRATLVRNFLLLLAVTTAFACADNGLSTAPRAPAVDARLSQSSGHGDKNAEVASCKPQKDDQKSARIGSHGGILKIGSNTLVVPAGALSTTVEITAHAIPSNSARLEFSPEGLQFAIPATLTMSYAKCETPLFGVVVAYLQADTVTEVEPSRNHLLQRTVSAEIRHFSSYAVAF